MGRDKAIACYRELGAEMRKRREEAGLTIRDLSCQIGCSTTTLWRFENGRHNLHPEDVIYYLGLCGIYPYAARDMVALCREAQRNLGYWLSPLGQRLPDSLSSLIYHEATADQSTSYQPQLVHGLLQTADYAHARIAAERWRSPEDVEECVRIRLHRQQVLHTPRPAKFVFFVHEQALRLQVGSPAIMHDQLLKLVLLTALKHVAVRVVPTSAGEHSEFGGPFHVFEYQQFQPLVYLDNHASALFLEDPDYVEPYRALIPATAEVALNGPQSREFLATLASEYDQRSTRDVDMEEEQL